jgi:hypothetical protein
MSRSSKTFQKEEWELKQNKAGKIIDWNVMVREEEIKCMAERK